MPLPLTRRSFLISALAVAACEPPPPRTVPDITFAHLQPIALDVGRVEVVQTYAPAMEPPFVDHLFPQPPAEVLRDWAQQRLRPVGSTGSAILTIQNASVRQELLARTGGLRSIFTVDQSERYTADFAVRLDAVSPAVGVGANTVATAQRTITVPENATLARREETWFALTENTVRDLEAALEANIRQHMGPLIRG